MSGVAYLKGCVFPPTTSGSLRQFLRYGGPFDRAWAALHKEPGLVNHIGDGVHSKTSTHYHGRGADLSVRRFPWEDRGERLNVTETKELVARLKLEVSQDDPMQLAMEQEGLKAEFIIEKGGPPVYVTHIHMQLVPA